MPKTRRKRRKRKTHSKISRKKRGGVTPLPTQASADAAAVGDVGPARARGEYAVPGQRRPDGRWMLTARHPVGQIGTEKIERWNNDRNIGTLWNKVRDIIRVINRCHMPPRDNCLD
jgi:hypothetical protein